MTTGQKIRNARLAMGISQSQAAYLIGVGQTRWSDIELDKHGLTVKVLRRVAAVLGVRPADLL